MKMNKTNLSIFALAAVTVLTGCTTVTVTNSSSGDEAAQQYSGADVNRKAENDIIAEELRAAVEAIKGMKLQSLHIEATGHKSTGFNSDPPSPPADKDGENTGERAKIFLEGMGEVEGELVKDFDAYEED